MSRSNSKSSVSFEDRARNFVNCLKFLKKQHYFKADLKLNEKIVGETLTKFTQADSNQEQINALKGEQNLIKNITDLEAIAIREHYHLQQDEFDKQLKTELNESPELKKIIFNKAETALATRFQKALLKISSDCKTKKFNTDEIKNLETYNTNMFLQNPRNAVVYWVNQLDQSEAKKIGKAYHKDQNFKKIMDKIPEFYNAILVRAETKGYIR